jgi:hypothetical protein
MYPICKIEFGPDVWVDTLGFVVVGLLFSALCERIVPAGRSSCMGHLIVSVFSW